MKTPPRYWLLLRAVTSAYMAVTLMEFMGGFSNGKSLLAAIKDLEDKHTRIEEHQQANEAGPALQLWNWATGVQEGQENSVQMLSRNVQLVLHSLWGDEVDHLKASPERARPQVLNLLKKKRKQLFITIISIVVLAVSFIMSASKRTICMKLIFNIFASIWFLGSGFWFQRTYDHRLFWMCLVAMQSQMRAAKREDDNENYEQVVEHGRGAVTRLMIRGPLAATCLFWFVNTLPGLNIEHPERFVAGAFVFAVVATKWEKVRDFHKSVKDELGQSSLTKSDAVQCLVGGAATFFASNP